MPGQVDQRYIESLAQSIVASGDPRIWLRARDRFGEVLQAVCDLLGATGGVIQLPAGDFPMNAPIIRRVDVDEGDVVMLDATHGPIWIVGAGAGKTRFISASNRLVLFSTTGAVGLTLQGITFVNPHGVLQNQPKALVFEPNRGVAGYGNGACAVLRQHDRADSVMLDCEVEGFGVGILHRGVAATNLETAGEIVVRRTAFTDILCGVVSHQATTVDVRQARASNVNQSINSDGSNDPGHLLYVTDRTGAAPVEVVCDGIECDRCSSSVLQIRKGEHVAIGSYLFRDVAAAFELQGVRRWTIAHGRAQITDFGGVGNQEAVNVIDCGPGVMNGGDFDMTETVARAIVLRSVDGAPPAWANKGARFVSVTLRLNFDNGFAALDVDLCSFSAQTGATFDQMHFEIYGSAITNNDESLVFFDAACVGCSLIHPRIQVMDDSPTTRLIKIASGCQNSRVVWTPAESNITNTPNTVQDFGTGTTIVEHV